MSSKLLKVWTLDSSVKTAVVCCSLTELKAKACLKLGFDVTSFKMEDGTDIDDDEIVQHLNPGSIVYALNAGEAIRSLATTLAIIPDAPDDIPVFIPLEASTPDVSISGMTSATEVQYTEVEEAQPSTSKQVVNRKRHRDMPANTTLNNNDVSITVALKKHPKESWIVEEGKKAVMAREARLAMVKAACSHLIDIFGDYPPTEKKVQMAKSIIQTFPNQKSGFGEGHEHYYSTDGTGFLQNRFRQIQRQLPEQQRKYRKWHKLSVNTTDAKANQSTQPGYNVEDNELKIVMLQNLVPLSANNDRIFQLMAETCSHRQNWIKGSVGSVGPTMAQIFQKYPRFIDVPGLMQQDFKIMGASATEDPAAHFESNLALKVIRYCVGQGKSLDLTQDFENFTTDKTSHNAMLCLLDMLPTMGKHRTSAKNARQFFMDEIKANESLEAYLEVCQQENKKLERFQPYILKMGAIEEASYYIICDGRALVVKPSKAANALLDLFSTFFVFNVRYPSQLMSFFNFLEVFMFDIKGKLPAKATALLKDLSVS